MEGTSPILVSIVMPVYNRAAQLGEAAASILNGTYRAIELIAVDDGSTDNSVTELETIGATDARLKIIRQANGGAYVARNVGAAAARGKYLAMIDADDVAMPNRLEKQVAFLEAHPDVVVLGGGMTMIDADGNTVREVVVPTDDAEIKSALRHQNPIHTTTVMMRKDAFDALGGFRKAFRVAGDYDLWLRMSEHYALANLAEPLAKYRVHGDQISTKKLGPQVMSMLACQAAAKVRRETGQDPLVEATAITPELLARMGVTQDQIHKSEMNAYLWWADLLAEADNPEMAIELLDKAAALSNTATTRRSTLAKIHRGYAKAYNMQDRTLRKLTSAARAKVIEMDWSPSGIARRVARRVSRVIPKRAIPQGADPNE